MSQHMSITDDVSPLGAPGVGQALTWGCTHWSHLPGWTHLSTTCWVLMVIPSEKMVPLLGAKKPRSWIAEMGKRRRKE